MFKREVKPLGEVLRKFLRDGGLETPLLQLRVVEAWDRVAGPMVARYTAEKFVKNQVLFVKIQNPALRQDLSMMRSQLVRRLNAAVGSSVIVDIRVY